MVFPVWKFSLSDMGHNPFRRDFGDMRPTHLMLKIKSEAAWVNLPINNPAFVITHLAWVIRHWVFALLPSTTRVFASYMSILQPTGVSLGILRSQKCHRHAKLAWGIIASEPPPQMRCLLTFSWERNYVNPCSESAARGTKQITFTHHVSATFTT